MIPKLSPYSLPTNDELPQCKAQWTVDPSRAALLIHDMQEYFLDFWGENSQFIKTLVAQVKLLRSICKAQGIPVYYTAQPINQKPEERALLTDLWGRGIDNYPHRQAIASEVKPDDDDLVLDKWRYSAFQRSQLKENLKEKGRDQLIICGVYAHIGCLATGIDAFMNDIQPFFVADALGDFTREQHDMALKMAAECCGCVHTLKGITNQLVESDLRKVVATILEGEDDDEWPEDDENLVDYGLDSIKIMALAGRWQRVYPEVDFVKLAEKPCLADWRLLLSV